MKIDDQESRRVDEGVSLWIWGASIVVVIFLWATSAFWIDVGAGEQKFDRGTFGDMFGAVNALFSGLALATLFYTVFLQRKELAETKRELVEQRKQMEIQNSTMLRQQFEQTFFNLLELLSASIKTLEYHDPSTMMKAVTGRACFAKHLSAMEFVPTSPLDTAFSPNEIQEWVQNAANELEKSSYGSLGQYISIVEQVTLFVHKSNQADGEKERYGDILQATLTQDEKALLFYYGLSPFGQVRLKPHIERYALLSNLRPHPAVSSIARGYYAPHAFGAGTPE